MENVRIIVRAKNNLIVDYRERNNLTQKELADLCGVSLSIIGSAERLLPIRLGDMEKIAEFIGAEPEELFPNYLTLLGEIINSGRKYLILNDETTKKIIESNYGGNTKLLKESFNDELEELFAVLDDKQKKVIKWYFGIGNGEKLDLEEIGERLNLTRERVRQIKERTLRILRKHKDIEILKEYIGIV